MTANPETPKGYNGWTNYETWLVALWIDNDQGTYETARELTRSAKDDAPDDARVPGIWTAEQAARYNLADALKDWVTDELLPDLGASFASDLMGAALAEVDWNEIAEHYLSDL